MSKEPQATAATLIEYLQTIPADTPIWVAVAESRNWESWTTDVPLVISETSETMDFSDLRGNRFATKGQECSLTLGNTSS